MMSHVVSGINAITEHLRQDRGIVKIFVARGRKLERLREVLELAKEKGIPISYKDRVDLDKLSTDSSHQGLIGVLHEYRYLSIQDLVKDALSMRGSGLLLVADHITDIGNLGSLIRTGEFFGVQGLILPRERSAAITEKVHKISAGGSAYLPVARVVNIARTLRELADQGFWIIGAAGESKKNIYEFDWNRDLVLVLGSEEKGITRIARDQCHELVSIPRVGHLDSLNLSVAGGIILSEIVRQRARGCSS